jgi:hypothetical protein
MASDHVSVTRSQERAKMVRAGTVRRLLPFTRVCSVAVLVREHRSKEKGRTEEEEEAVVEETEGPKGG